MYESTCLLQLANNIEILERMKYWAEGKPPDSKFDVRVEWLWGSGVSGYKDVVTAVKPYLEDNLADIIQDAIRKQEAKVKKLKEECRKFLCEDSSN